LPRLNTRSPGNLSIPKRPSSKNSPPSTSSTIAPPINSFPSPSSPTDLLYARLLRCPKALLLVIQLREQAIHIERAGDHRESPVDGTRPLLPGAVPVQLDAVVVGVAQVQGLGDAMV
jgi:hypothetical protein